MIEQKDVVVSLRASSVRLLAAGNKEMSGVIDAAIVLIECLNGDRDTFKEQARAAGVELNAERDTSAALRNTLERVTKKLKKAKAKADELEALSLAYVIG